MTLETLNLILLGGIVLGALYALMATGLALVWTTLGIFNFAHGTFIALGAYIAWQIASTEASGAGLLAGAGVSIIGMFVIGMFVYYLLIKPFERNPDIVVKSVITTLAGATILENVINLVWGPRNKQLSPLLGGDMSFLGITISRNEMAVVALALVILAALGVFLQRAPLGRAMRAVAQNREAAQLMGIDVERLYAIAFGLSAALAALAGILIGSIRFMNPSMGSDPLMKALIVVIFGGIARFTGPIYAAFIVGLLEAVMTYLVGLYWSPTVLFAIMIVVLVAKPEGLFGRYRKSV
ncbi:branched-chain amino acid ABC transporter permease [Mesorhizobium sp. M2C.T.Ca.TU.002.02.1.1]|uniref:branched-chain amino acid ABC transporter permease n=1 Tax=Mesorhizobium sp. M2C.T.Ca.TU.002.02.1.1 TaxID=2496788 RepID=UPI000FCC0E60|nr:branched-chain amino acid ABC transporter permease [Mesorhizobium sp. M2C.T.Ca.TU.002.02.1.1]RUU58676.1 branched-chain amino acid ABC transporter permease [Mesorhizobium sp. M2C.T.Ca.TU.002.02.1.1]RUU72060.1 branched-chain amino acid ABC transporter permease [Mesorhizobium sp. M2C.T.Ca.TU.009.01.2.1]